MAFPSTLTSSSPFTTNSLFYTSARAPSSLGLSTLSPSVISFSRSCKTFRKPNAIHQQIRKYNSSIKALSLDFSGSFFEGGLRGEDSPPGPPISVADDKEEPQCPPGLRQYETMAVLRPDLTEDERLVVTQKYEELLVAGGGMYVEVFNRGVIPLAYSIKTKNKAGETNSYFDGIYLLFTYFTKPESISALETMLKTDDDVIRSSTFKIRKRKY